MSAGIVDAKTLHIDATLIRADVSWDSLTTTHIEEVLRENPCSDTQSDVEPVQNQPKKRGRPRTKQKHPKKRSTTDPDATMATSCRTHHLAPSFKQHTAVETHSGVVVDVDVSTGEANEGTQLMEQVERIEQTTGEKIEVLTADAGYAHSANYAALEQRGTQALIPPQKESSKAKTIPLRRFKYDEKHGIVRCPAAKIMHPSCRNEKLGGWIYRMSTKVCRACRLRKHCLPPSASSRSVFISDGYTAMLRARRYRQRWDEREKQIYNRHRGLVEGRHGEAKTQHGLNRATRRGLENVAIQSYLVAAVMNLKRLAAAVLFSLSILQAVRDRLSVILNRTRPIFA
jgi:hypothetical protein